MDKAPIQYKLSESVVLAWRAYIASLSGMQVKKLAGVYWNVNKKVGSSKHGDMVLEVIIRDYLRKRGVEI